MLEYIKDFKLYLNERLYEKVLEELGLDLEKLSQDQNQRAKLKKLLKGKVVNTDLDYSPDQLQNFVVREYEKVKKYGGIILEIKEFIKSGEIKLPDGLSEDTLVDLMLEYLIDIGYQTGVNPFEALKDEIRRELANPNDSIRKEIKKEYEAADVKVKEDLKKEYEAADVKVKEDLKEEYEAADIKVKEYIKDNLTVIPNIGAQESLQM